MGLDLLLRKPGSVGGKAAWEGDLAGWDSARSFPEPEGFEPDLDLKTEVNDDLKAEVNDEMPRMIFPLRGTDLPFPIKLLDPRLFYGLRLPVHVRRLHGGPLLFPLIPRHFGSGFAFPERPAALRLRLSDTSGLTFEGQISIIVDRIRRVLS